MKKYITIAALLAAGTAFANADTLTLFDQWTFDSGLTSVKGKRTFTGQQHSLSYKDGVCSLGLNNDGVSGLHLDDNNTLGLTGGNWALQITMNLGATNTTNTAQVLACLNNASGGTQVAISNSADGNVYGIATAPGFTNWGENSRTDAEATTGSMTTLTVLNYDGKLYLAQGKEWAKFGTNSDSCDLGDDTLGKLTLGFGQGGANGVAAQTILIDDISVFTFLTDSATLDSVKSELIANAVPEPSAFGLLAGIGALALVASRRRRK